MITVPDGAQSGTHIRVHLADGREVGLQVPPGVEPGQSLQVVAPAASSVATTEWTRPQHLLSVAVQELISVCGLGFDATTFRDELFTSITAHLPMVRPALARARARLCNFIERHSSKTGDRALWAFTWRADADNFPLRAATIDKEDWQTSRVLKDIVEYCKLAQALMGDTSLSTIYGLPSDLTFERACQFSAEKAGRNFGNLGTLLLLQLRDGIYRFRAAMGFAACGSGGEASRKTVKQSFVMTIKTHQGGAKYAEYELALHDGRSQASRKLKYQPTMLQTLHARYPTEESVLHAIDPLLGPTVSRGFAEKGLEGILSPEDAEELLCALTEPYVRVPLVLAFFSTRVDALLSPALQKLLELAVFSPGAYTSVCTPPVSAPCASTFTATTNGLLSNEIAHAPLGVLQPLCHLLADASKLRAGGHTSEFVPATTFLATFTARLLGYVRDALGDSLDGALDEHPGGNAHAAVDGERPSPGSVYGVAQAVALVEAWLEHTAHHLEEVWLPMARSTGSRQLMCQLHACRASIAWSMTTATTYGGAVRDASVGDAQLLRLFSSLAFLTNWHKPGIGLVGDPEEESGGKDESAANSQDGRPDEDQSGDELTSDKPANKSGEKATAAAANAELLGVADQEVFALAQARRWEVASLVEARCASGRDGEASNSAGSQHQSVSIMLTQALQLLTETDSLWNGVRPSYSPNGHLVKCGSDDNRLVCNVQEYEILFGASSLQPLPDEVNRDLWWQNFWRARGPTPHCTPVQPKCAHVLELLHVWDPVNSCTLRVELWSKPTSCEVEGMPSTPQRADQRAKGTLSYGNQSYGGSEREYILGKPAAPIDLAWVPAILDPVLKTLEEDTLKRTQLLLPRAQLPYDATCCVVLAVTAEDGENGTTKSARCFYTELRIDRLIGCVDAFAIDILGRRAFPQQTYTSDARYSLWCPRSWDNASVKMPLPPALLHAEGKLLRAPQLGQTTLIEKTARSGQRFQHVPANGLKGQLPHALLENFDFWQALDDSNHQRGSRAGELVGERRVELGGERPVDAFFDFALRVQFQSRGIHANSPGVDGHLETLVLRDEPRAVGGTIATEAQRRAISRQPSSSAKGGSRRALTTRTYRRLVPLKYCAASAADAHLVLSLMPRLDNLSHILAWTCPHQSETTASADSTIDLVELPRLKLRFSMRTASDGSRGLYTSTGKRVLNNQEGTSVPHELLSGLSRCLIVADLAGAVEIIVPSYPLLRRRIAALPFSRHVKPDVNAPRWLARCEARTFTYVLHASEQHVLFGSLAAALYWAACKLYARQYEAAFTAICSCATDLALSEMEAHMLTYFTGVDDDEHPNAYACRVQLFVGLVYSPTANGLLASGRVQRCLLSYAAKSRLVSAACRVALNGEYKLAVRLRDEAKEKVVPTELLNRIIYLEDALGRTATGGGKVELHLAKQEDGGAKWYNKVLESTRSARRTHIFAMVYPHHGRSVDAYEALDLAWCAKPSDRALTCIHLSGPGHISHLAHGAHLASCA